MISRLCHLDIAKMTYLLHNKGKHIPTFDVSVCLFSFRFAIIFVLCLVCFVPPAECNT
jgi:hypothetical protein